MPDSPKDVSVTVRLPREMALTLEMIASGERSTVSDIIRLAIKQYLNPIRKESA